MKYTIRVYNTVGSLKPKRQYLFTLLLLVPITCFSAIYKWTDENGRVHYGDSPRKEDNAKKVTVKINSYKSVSYEKFTPSKSAQSYTKPATPKEVTMYGTSWCRYCKSARDYFEQNGIDYTEYDIEKDMHAKREYDELGGKGVPVILVGERRMNGFSAKGFKRIYE